MQKLKVLKIIFEGELESYEIPALRGAIAQKVGLDQVLFHNHLGNKFRYSYPLIQYKRIAGRPALVCIGDGVEDIHHFFTQKDWAIEISGRSLPMQIENLEMNQFTMGVWDKLFHYKMNNWIALHQQAWAEFGELETEKEKITYLEKKLTGNILSFAKGIGWFIEERVHVKIKEILYMRGVRVKQVKLTGFGIRFACNVFLPHSIGLGKNVSIGYGSVSKDHILIPQSTASPENLAV